MKRDSIVFLTDKQSGAEVPLRSYSKSELLALFETRRLMRAAFYADIGRKPPTRTDHMPSYVRAVKLKWELLYNNSARQLLAEIEGFPNWDALMKAD